MRLERLVQIETRETPHIEPREPHRTDEHHAQRIPCILELLVQCAFHHLRAMRADLQPPRLKRPELILIRTDDHRHLRLPHPCQPALELLRLLLRGGLDACREIPDRLLPVLLHIVVHPHTRHLVQADEHRLTARP